MCRLHHKGRSGPKRGCKVRQDIYEKVGSKVRKHCKIWDAKKSGLQLCGVK